MVTSEPVIETFHSLLLGTLYYMHKNIIIVILANWSARDAWLNASQLQ